MKRGVLSITFLLTITLLPVHSATPPKSGSTCTKQGATKTYQGKKYTCIKSGKKLIWDKGASVAKPNAAPIASPTPTPTPTPSPTPSPILSSVPTPTPTQERVFEDSSCTEIGQIITASGKQFLCRYIAEKRMFWVQISGSNDAPTTSINSSDVDNCKIQDLRTNKFYGNGNVGFPLTMNAIKPNGIVKVAVLPVNFPDSPKVESPNSYWKPYSDLLDQRNSYLYENRIKYEWTIPSEWLMMSKGAEYFASDHVTVQPDGSRKSDGVNQILSSDEQASLIFSEAEKNLKIEDFDFFWIFTNPLETRVPQGPYGRFQDVKTTKTLYRRLNYYMLGNRIYSGAYHLGPIGTLQDTIAHEMAHYQGMIQHAPGNGWGWYVSNNPTWESWITGWRPDAQYVCIDSTQNWTEAQFHLSSIDLNSKGYKSGVIKISDSQVLVIESRRPGPFTTALPKTISGITAYIVDTTKSGERWDGNVDKELDYFMYFLRNNGNKYPIQKFQNLAVWDENIIAYQGDSFSYKNLTIALTKSGDYDTVLVTRK